MAPAPPRSERQVEVVAYMADGLAHGYLTVGSRRVSDFLNATPWVTLVDVLFVPLAQEGGQIVRELVVDRASLAAIAGGGPRGEQARRNRTRPWPVELRSGPYHMRGYLHAPPTVDALAHFWRRAPMVPLTDARIEYTVSGQLRRTQAATLIVNRDLVDAIERSSDDELDFPDLPVPAVKGILVKDFTELVVGD